MNNLENKAKFYHSIGELSRLKILEYLLKKNQCTCICEFSKFLKKDQSVVFRHVQILKQAGIIDTHKEAKYLMCCIKDKEKVRKILED